MLARRACPGFFAATGEQPDEIDQTVMYQMKRKIRVASDLEVSSVWAVPDGYKASEGAALILAHGAGNDMSNPLLSHVHEALAGYGLLTLKFNFLYKERGARAPDRAPILEATWQAVIAAVRSDPELAPKRIFFGGKSMGGRLASQLVAKGENCAGLVFLGYPLHPPNKPQSLRTDHWSRLHSPMLFIQATRDALCQLDLLKAALRRVEVPVTLHVIEGGDHSFKVFKTLGRSEQEIEKEIVAAICRWLSLAR